MSQAVNALDAVLKQIRDDGDVLELVDELLDPPRCRAGALSGAALLDVLIRLAGPAADGAEVVAQILAEAQRRGWPVAEAAAPPLPPAASGEWLSPERANLQHGQVWTVRTTSGSVVPLAQIDGYDREGGRQRWRAINLATGRTLRVHRVLHGSCPRLGGRRERAK